jgi:stringent starvation protein B
VTQHFVIPTTPPHFVIPRTALYRQRNLLLLSIGVWPHWRGVYPARMSEQSAKPYLVRAICEWCADNGFTPYLAVKVSAQTRVPPSFVKNGEIVLNISPSATRKLTIDNEWIQFAARFNGVSQEVSVPMNAVSGIFAKETGYGFAFTIATDPVASLAGATVPKQLQPNDTEAKDQDTVKSRRPSHLQIIK